MKNKLEMIEGQLQTLADFRKRPVLCIVGALDQRAVLEIRGLLPQMSDLEERFVGQLSVLLESPGGYGQDAYRIALGLREHVEDLEVLVPHKAKSAATLLCLAADSIHLGPHGELGPLDPQMLNLRGSAVPLSALESFNTLDQLLRYSLDSLDGVVQHLVSASLDRKAPMDYPYAIKHAQPLFAAIVSPLFSQVDPHELGDAGRSLQVSEEYAVRVMRRWGYKKEGSDKCRKIARRLTWDYPTHGFIIDLTEAVEIGLKAQRLDSKSVALSQEILQETTEILQETTGYVGLAFPNDNDCQTDTSDSQQEYSKEPHAHDTEKGDETSERSPDGRPHAISA